LSLAAKLVSVLLGFGRREFGGRDKLKIKPKAFNFKGLDFATRRKVYGTARISTVEMF
jgi:hypothetical protein